MKCKCRLTIAAKRFLMEYAERYGYEEGLKMLAHIRSLTVTEIDGEPCVERVPKQALKEHKQGGLW